MFVTEPVPIDVTAVGIMVTLMILGPWTGVSPREGVSGFSNPATITILAMMILSEGVRRTGAIQRLEQTVASYTGESEHKQLGATVGLVGPLSGIINNTAAVAVLLPMVSDLAHENGTSPSKLLIPLSHASMAGPRTFWPATWRVDSPPTIPPCTRSRCSGSPTSVSWYFSSPGCTSLRSDTGLLRLT